MKSKVTQLRKKRKKERMAVMSLFRFIPSSMLAVLIAVGLSLPASSASAVVLVDTGMPFTKGFGGQPILADEFAVDDFQIPAATTITRIELLMFTIGLAGPDPTIRVQITDAIGPGATPANLVAEFTATVSNPANLELTHYVQIPMQLALEAGTYYIVVSSDNSGGRNADWVVGAPNGTPGQGMQARQVPPFSFVDSTFPPASQFFDILPAVDYSFRIITEDTALAPVLDDTSKMYFSNLGNDTILRANLDGTGRETLVTGQHIVFSTAVDAAAGKLYWTELQLGVPGACCSGTPSPGHWASIKRSDLDGSDMEVVLTKGHGVKHPTDIKLDPTDGKLYWADGGDRFNGGRIYRANLDGSNVELLVDVISLRAPDFSQATGFEFGQVWGLALDSVAGQFYWTDYFGGDIHRALLDGTGIEQLFTGLSTARGIALDTVEGMMYWATGDFGNEIMRGDLNGVQAEVIVDKGLGTRLKQPFNVALDTAAGHVYWTDMDTGRIQRADLAGLDVVTLVELGGVVKGKFKADSIAGLTLNLADVPAGGGVPTPADLAVEINGTSNSITVGDPVTYTLTVTNWGPGRATGVVLTDNLSGPAVIVSTSANCNTVANAVTCAIGSLAPGASASADVTVTSDVAGILSNAVAVAGIQPDPASANDTAALDTVVDPAAIGPGGADLIAEITRLRSKVRKGQM